ncbi:MAG TPA: efflux RND transporter permease subunit [Longimicrobiales bacterium]
MDFVERFVRRPVLSSMVSLGLVLIGVLGYGRLPVREFPDADAPVVTVSVVLPGASPQVVESSVTDVLEEELSSLEGLRSMTSASQEQISTITLEFTLDREIEDAAQDVRDKVARVRGLLPEDIEEPVVAKQEADAFPFMFLALTSKKYDLMELSDIADRVIKPRLQTVSGVSGVGIYGERRFAMRVWLSPRELAARGLTVQDVEGAIRTRSVEIPAGRIESDRREFSVRYLGEMRSPDEFASLTVANNNGQLVKLGDVARVEPGPEDDRSVTRYSQQDAIFLGVIRQSKSNIIEIAEAVQEQLPAVQAALPPGVELNMAFDGSVFVQRSITEAKETLLLTAALVILIIFLFLRTLRATIIPAIAIPVSIIGTFAILSAMNYSINTLTLLGLILAIGIVVDDAIIVLENAFRHQEELLKDPETAAIDGTKEITTAVIATTIALLAVFSPLLFLTGATGRLFNEFGVAVGGSVLLSGIVALTLTPMLSAKILKVSPRESRFSHAIGAVLDKITHRYGRSLTASLKRPSLVIAGGVLLTLSAVFLFKNLEREFVPADDRSFFFTFVIAPEGATVQYTDGYLKQLEAIVEKTEGVKSSFAIVGFGGPPNSGFLGTILEDWEHREKSAQEIIDEVQPQFFFGVPGVFAFATNPPAFGGFGAPVQFVVQHSDFEKLVQGMDTLVARARMIPGLVNVDTDLRVTRPELVVTLDRDRAEDLGVPARDVALTMGTLLGGRDVSRFTSDNKLYDVILRLDPGERSTPSDISGLQVRGRNGELVQLDAVTRVEERVGPRQLNHHNRVRAFTLSASMAPGFTLGAALDSLTRVANEVLPGGSTIDLAGESRELQDSGNTLYFAFVLSLIFVFMVLAAQFESLVHPFTVLLAVPLAVTGALGALWIAGSTLNVYSQVGMILLIGLVSKNSILLVTYANDLRKKGNDAVSAMLEAGRIRLRPILMTSAAAIFGALPIALGLGAGAGSRRPLGYAIVGGLIVSTLLTLYLVPAVFVVLERLRGKDRAKPLDDAPRAEPRELVHAAPIIALLLLALPAAALAQTPTVSLSDARERALGVARQSVAARTDVETAVWERRSAVAQLVTPSITAGSSYIRFSDPFFNFGTGTVSPNATSATLEARYDLIGAAKLQGLKRSSAVLANAEAIEVATTYRVAYEADLAYFGVLAERELARVADERLKRAEEQFGLARVRVQAGEAIATDSLQLLLELNRARLAKLRSDSALAVARLRLGNTIGESGPADAAPVDSALPPPLPFTQEQAVAELRTSGPELVAARAGERRAEALLTSEKEAYLPNLSLSATTGAYDAEFWPSAFKRSQLAVTVAFPIWDGGQRELAVARARADRTVARAERAERERGAAEAVAQAYLGYETARAGIDLARVGAAVASETYRVQRARYREGATTILDLLEAQVALSEAEATLVQSRYAAHLTLARLEALLGRRVFGTR